MTILVEHENVGFNTERIEEEENSWETTVYKMVKMRVWIVPCATLLLAKPKPEVYIEQQQLDDDGQPHIYTAGSEAAHVPATGRLAIWHPHNVGW